MSPAVTRCILLLPLLSGCIIDLPGIRGNGVADSEDREVEAFDRVEVSHAIHLELDVDPDAADPIVLTVSGDSNLLEHVETEVRDTTLVVTTDSNVRPDLDLVVNVVVPSLVAAEVRDAATLDGRGMDTDAFELDVADAATANLDGRADALDVSVTDAATGKLLHLDVIDAHVRVRSAASLTLCATGNVTGSVSDASSLDIYCDPASVNVDVSDVSDLDIHD